MTNRPPVPAPTPAAPCVYGCSPSTGWRHYRTGWERACDRHRGGRGAFVPDVANQNGGTHG